MSQDQLSISNPNNHSASSQSDLRSFWVPPVSPATKSSIRQQVLDRILGRISEQDLLGKSYVEQYLRHKYRRNCKANTLRQAAISLVQFLSFFASKENIVLEQLSREDIEALVEALQDRGLKPTMVNIEMTTEN